MGIMSVCANTYRGIFLLGLQAWHTFKILYSYGEAGLHIQRGIHALYHGCLIHAASKIIRFLYTIRRDAISGIATFHQEAYIFAQGTQLKKRWFWFGKSLIQ